MRHYRLWAALVLVLALVGAGVWAFWNFELRWRPKTITKHQAEIAATLNAAGWVSPDQSGRKLYMVAYRDCAECARLIDEEFPALQAKAVDTRVIEVAQADLNGQPQSTPAERATVAQLWISRDWKLLQAWMAADAWTAPGVPPADSDMARMAVVEAGRSTVAKLTPLLKDNGVGFAYPLLVWWDDQGAMRACACESRRAFRDVRKELGGG